jgi:hypothetical protein
MLDEGIYIINTDGTGEQQITSGGIVPTWQPIIDTSGNDSGSIIIPNVPNTATNESQNYAGVVLLASIIGLVILAVILLRFLKNKKNNLIKR